DAPGDDGDARRHGLEEAAREALLPGEERGHVDVRQQPVDVLAVAREFHGGGDAEVRGEALARRAERAVADQAQPGLRARGVDPREDVQKVVIVIYGFEASAYSDPA